MVKLDKKLFELHNAFDKHVATPAKYYAGTDDDHLYQCTCGAWRWAYYETDKTDPVYGEMVADFIANNPKIRASLREYFLKVLPKIKLAAGRKVKWSKVLQRLRYLKTYGT